MVQTLPEYPETRPVALYDRPLLRRYFRDVQPKVSELSFANIYLFRNVHQYSLCSLNGSLLIAGCGYDGLPYFLPPLSGDRGRAARDLLSDGRVIYGADETFIKEHLSGADYSTRADRDNDDYLHLRSDLADLPGKHFHKKKNRINYFTSRHTFLVEQFTKMHRQGADQLLDTWLKTHDVGDSRSLHAEVAAAREGIELADELGLTGVAIMIGGTVAAFALGEMLNDSTAVCHFEKESPFTEGLSQLVNREFSRNQPAECIYINREQDLGEAGLRQAKSSYLPLVMIRKFLVFLSANNI